jgi:hypothetical protein
MPGAGRDRGQPSSSTRHRRARLGAVYIHATLLGYVRLGPQEYGAVLLHADSFAGVEAYAACAVLGIRLLALCGLASCDVILAGRLLMLCSSPHCSMQ